MPEQPFMYNASPTLEMSHDIAVPEMPEMSKKLAFMQKAKDEKNRALSTLQRYDRFLSSFRRSSELVVEYRPSGVLFKTRRKWIR